jgi:hypothetical protein
LSFLATSLEEDGAWGSEEKKIGNLFIHSGERASCVGL